MKNIGLHLDGLLFKKAELDGEGKPHCSYDCGFLAGPVQDGMLAQFGSDSFATLKSEILPGGSPTLCFDRAREFSKFVLPPWAIWTRIRAVESKNRKWPCHNAVGESFEIDLEEHLGRLIKAEVSRVQGKGALVVDDDLELSAQDRLIRYLGGGVDLLPKSVACVLSFIKGKQNNELVTFNGKQVLIVSVGMDRTTITRVTLRWLDDNWEETDSVTDGYLVPEIEQKEQRVLPPLSYISMDVYSAASSKEYFEDTHERLFNLWANKTSALLGHPILHWSSTGWHEDFSLTSTTFDQRIMGKVQDGLGTENQNNPFSPKILKEHLDEISDEEIDLILISDESFGFLTDEILTGLKSLNVDLELVEEEISIGALDFLEKQDLGKPTYRERLPDIFIRGQLEGSRPDWFPLVKSMGDFAHGGSEYNQRMDFRAEIEPYKENVLINLKMGVEDSDANLKRAELIFNFPSTEKIVFDINVQVKASQGYGVVSLIPINSEEFRKKNGDIILDWQKLEQGFIEEDSGLAAPPANEIECLKYDNQNSCYDNILNAFAVLTVRGERLTIEEIRRYLIEPAHGIHPGMRNGLTFGSNPEEGIKKLVLPPQGWNETPGDVWIEFLEFNETLKILWDNLGRFNIAERSQLKDWIARAGSHLWSDTQEFIIEYLSYKIQSSRAVQFIEAAGRSFHDPDSVKIFIEQFKLVGWERAREIEDPFSDRETLGMQQWFKAFSFIFRTNEPVYKWVPSHQFQIISKIFRYQVWCEWKKFKKEQLEQVLAADLLGNQTNFPTNLSSPLRQTFLACLYVLRLREENYDLFGLTATEGPLKQDQEFARKLYQVLFESWLHIPWFEPSEHLTQRVINTSVITPTPNNWFRYLFLWPEEQEVYSETELLEKYDLAEDLDIMDSNQSLQELLSDCENEGWIAKKDNGWAIDAMPSQWKSAFLYEEKLRKPIQIKIARFLLKKADNSDLTITGMFTDVFS